MGLGRPFCNQQHCIIAVILTDLVDADSCFLHESALPRAMVQMAFREVAALVLLHSHTRSYTGVCSPSCEYTFF